MKKLLCVLLFLSSYAHAQKVPEYDNYQVRIADQDRAFLFEVRPVKGHPRLMEDRWYSWYSANRIQDSQGGYSGKLLNGLFRSFYANKNLMEQGAFHEGLRTGIWKNWRADGTISQSVNWENGLMTGAFSKFNDKGILILTGHYKNGLMDGAVRQLSDSSAQPVTWYKNGLINEHRPFLKRLPFFHKKKAN